MGDKINSITTNISSLTNIVNDLSSNKLDKTADAANALKLGGVPASVYKYLGIESYTNKCLNGDNTALEGLGNITVKLYHTGVAEIQFYIRILTADSNATTAYNWGINRDYFYQYNSNISSITPLSNCGWWAHFRNGTLVVDSAGWAPTFEISGQFWKFSRNYTGTNVALGSYPASWPYANDIFIGTCYGAYSTTS